MLSLSLSHCQTLSTHRSRIVFHVEFSIDTHLRGLCEPVTFTSCKATTHKDYTPMPVKLAQRRCRQPAVTAAERRQLSFVRILSHPLQQ